MPGPGAGGEEPPLPADAVAAAAAPAEDLPIEPLDQDGVRGGRIVLEIAGSRDEVLEMLLDFEGANERRPWAKRYETLSRSDSTVVARWSFEGKLGIDPTVDLHFTVERRDDEEVVVSYRSATPVFGLAAFFGDYRILPAPEKGDGFSLLAERVFIESGVAIANASEKDIADGLRADAKAMRAFMEERLRRPR